MDKNTLSNYGWIVIAVLVLAVMIALATPFGKYVENGVKSTTAGLFDTSEKAMNVVGMSAGEGEFDEGYNAPSNNKGYDHNAPELHPGRDSNIIPENATYKIKEGKFPNFTYTTLQSGDTFPDTITNGSSYTYGDYKYTYSNNSGWSVKVIETDKTEYGPILESINNISISSLTSTFANCANMTVAPVIPKNVTSLDSTFVQCHSLIKAPAIPETVTNMNSTFKICVSLTDLSDCKLPNNLQSLVEAFLDSGITDASSLIIPSTCKSIGSAFQGCANLTKPPVISEGVEDLYFAFYGAGLTTAPIIPSTATNISCAFLQCTNLSGSITINAVEPSNYEDCLRDTSIYEILGNCVIKDEILATK